MVQKLFKIFLISLGFIITACSSFLYQPSREKIYDPKTYKLDYEDIYFVSENKQKLHGWWFPARTKNPKGTFVFFHGNGENLSSHFLSMGWLPENSYNYFIFDYPGYGQSEGEPNPRDNVYAGKAALKWVYDNKEKKNLIVYGQSMGGIAAMRSVIEVKDSIPVKALIADGTFSSFQRIARQKLGEHWLTWLLQPMAYVVLSDKWAADPEKISPTPLLVMHGEQDFIIPLKSGERLFEDAKEPKAFYKISQGHHGDLFWVQNFHYRKVVLDYLEKLPEAQP